MHSTERFTHPDYHDGVQTSLALPPAAKKYFLIIIIKTSSTGPPGKNKIVYKLLTQPHKQLQHGKLKNKRREATND